MGGKFAAGPTKTWPRSPQATDADELPAAFKAEVAKRALERDGELLLIGKHRFQREGHGRPIGPRHMRLLAPSPGDAESRLRYAQTPRVRIDESNSRVQEPALLSPTAPADVLHRAFEVYEPDHLRRHLQLAEEPDPRSARYALSKAERDRCARAQALLEELDFFYAEASRDPDANVQEAEKTARRLWPPEAEAGGTANPELPATIAAAEALADLHRAQDARHDQLTPFVGVSEYLRRVAAPARLAEIEGAAIAQGTRPGRGGARGPLTRARRLRRLVANVCVPLREHDRDFWTWAQLGELLLRSSDDWTEAPCPGLVAALAEGQDVGKELERAHREVVAELERAAEAHDRLHPAAS